MVHGLLQQFMKDVDWGELDYLIVDLPPGTSDSPLTVMQTLTLDGFVVVTTPQELSKVDALRSINMIKTLKVKVLGIVENFSGEMFGSGAGEELASELDLPFLGRLELRSDYRDTSRPTVLTSKTVLGEYQQIVEQAKAVLETLDAAQPEPAEDK